MPGRSHLIGKGTQLLPLHYPWQSNFPLQIHLNFQLHPTEPASILNQFLLKEKKNEKSSIG